MPRFDSLRWSAEEFTFAPERGSESYNNTTKFEAEVWYIRCVKRLGNNAKVIYYYPSGKQRKYYRCSDLRQACEQNIAPLK